jgi:hypothetical protein
MGGGGIGGGGGVSWHGGEVDIHLTDQRRYCAWVDQPGQ